MGSNSGIATIGDLMQTITVIKSAISSFNSIKIPSTFIIQTLHRYS